MLGHVRWAREVRVTPFMHWLEHGVQFDYPAIDGIEAGWGRFYGANVSAKRELVERVGGFDEVRLPYGYEDLDFGYRARRLRACACSTTATPWSSTCAPTTCRSTSGGCAGSPSPSAASSPSIPSSSPGSSACSATRRGCRGPPAAAAT